MASSGVVIRKFMRIDAHRAPLEITFRRFRNNINAASPHTAASHLA
jgi:hypothetical protein